MSYEGNDLGYDIGYDSEPIRPSGNSIQQADGPEGPRITYQMQAPPAAEKKSRIPVTPSIHPPGTPGAGGPQPKPVDADGKPIPPATPKTGTITKQAGKFFVNDGKTSKGPYDSVEAAKAANPELTLTYTPPKSNSGHRRSLGKVEKSVPIPDQPTSFAADKFSDPANARAQSALTKAGLNADEAGTYLILVPFPKETDAKYKNIWPKSKRQEELQKDQTVYLDKVNSSKPDDLKAQMADANVAEWLKFYKDQGIPIDVAYADLKAQGLIAQDAKAPESWPSKSNYILPHGKEVPESFKKRNPLSAPKAEKFNVVSSQRHLKDMKAPNALGKNKTERIEGVKNHMARASIVTRAREMMMTPKDKGGLGYTEDQANGVLKNMGVVDSHGNVTEFNPEEYAAYLFEYDGEPKGPVLVKTENSYLVRSDKLKMQTPKYGNTTVDIYTVPPTKVAGYYASPFTQAVMDYAKVNVSATPEHVAPGATGGPSAKGSGSEVKSDGDKDKASLPPGVDDKYAKVYAEAVQSADPAVTAMFAKMGITLPNGTGSSDAGGISAAPPPAWSVPGGSTDSGRPKHVNTDALSLERNQMRALTDGDDKLSDTEMAEYQRLYQGRSKEEIEKNTADLKKMEPKAALAKIRSETKVMSEALGQERARMKTMGFTDSDIKEWQRQNAGRSALDVGKSFVGVPSTKFDDTVKTTRDGMRAKMYDDAAEALMKVKPGLSKDNALLMARQLYGENSPQGSQGDGVPLDGMVTARKDVEEGIRLIQDKPEAFDHLKERTNAALLADYYDKVDEVIGNDKALKKFYTPENKKFFAHVHGVDLDDPSSIKKMTDRIGKPDDLGDKLKGFPKTAEAKEDSPQRQTFSQSGIGQFRDPDWTQLDKKDRGKAKVQWEQQKITWEKQEKDELRKRKWQVEDQNWQRNNQVIDKAIDMRHALGMAILQSKMQQDNQMLNTAVNQLGQMVSQGHQALYQMPQETLRAMREDTRVLLQSQLQIIQSIMQGLFGGQRGR